MAVRGTLAILLVCVVLVGVVSANYFPAFPVHSFLWSGNRYFTTQNEECLSTLRTNALSELASQSPSALSKYVSQDAAAPEVLVVFVEAKSALSHSAYAYLQTILSRAASSVLLPYVYRDEQTTSEAIRAAFTAAPTAHVVVAGDKEGAVKVADLQAELVSKAVFSNGVVDLVIVHLSESDKAAVDSVDAAVQQATSGNYVAIFTADVEFQREQRTPSQKEMEIHNRIKAEETEASERAVRSVLEARDSNYYSQRQFWPKEIWEGIFVTVMLGFILITGFWCTFELQTPLRWEKAKVVAHQQ